jgi:vesicle-fusing ATPase
MLNAREPKIVNGPQILDKYVGESEANIRKLFAEADEEEKRVYISPSYFSKTIPFFI